MPTPTESAQTLGHLGGEARKRKLSSKERREIARKGGIARNKK